MEAGTCYVDALERFVEVLRSGLGQVWLCHGTPILTKPPYCRYGHAWVEFEWANGTWVFDGARPGVPIPRDAYYRAGKIDYVCRYTSTQVVAIMGSHGHAGPWDDRVAAAVHADDPLPEGVPQG